MPGIKTVGTKTAERPERYRITGPRALALLFELRPEEQDPRRCGVGRLDDDDGIVHHQADASTNPKTWKEY